MKKFKYISAAPNIILYISLVICAVLVQSCASTPKFTGKEGASNKEKELPPPTDKHKVIEYDYGTAVLETTAGIASYYGEKFNGRKTASGEIYNMNELTAAHLNYPFGTIVRVTNTKNSQSVILKINDRMPDYNGRVIDVSYQAAKELGMLNDGLAKVEIEVLSWGVTE